MDCGRNAMRKPSAPKPQFEPAHSGQSSQSLVKAKQAFEKIKIMRFVQKRQLLPVMKKFVRSLGWAAF
jgi:hypothetical protein